MFEVRILCTDDTCAHTHSVTHTHTQCTVQHSKQVITKINSDPATVADVDIYNMLSRFTLDWSAMIICTH